MFCCSSLVLISAVVLLIYKFLIWNFDYWKRNGINGPKPKPFVGSFPNVFTQKKHMTCEIQEYYESFKNTDNFVGVFSCRTPQLLITNAELVRRVYVTDFKYFHDNEASTMVDEKSDLIFAQNPFTLTGDIWKDRRAEITPGLTANRIKTVFPVTQKVCKTMIEYIEQQMKIGDKNGLDAKDLSLRFTCEVTSDCVLGINANCFNDKSSPSPILENTKKLFEHSFVLIMYIMAVGLFPVIKKIKKLRFVPKTIEEFFVNLMQSCLDMRKYQRDKGLNEDRTDFMNYMLELQKKKNLTIPEITAHTMTFLVDGFETTASVLSHCLLMLGRDLTRQSKLRQEILETLGDKNDFDVLNDMPYLDACVHESLRIFPPGGFSTKLCTESTVLENKNGKTFKVPKGTVVLVPIHAVLNDEQYYPNPDSFEPERFLDGGLKSYRERGLYMAFGDGPRVCLGMRFALTQMKAALVEILRAYEIKVNAKTRSDNKLDPTYFMLRLDGGIWLDFNKI